MPQKPGRESHGRTLDVGGDDDNKTESQNTDHRRNAGLVIRRLQVAKVELWVGGPACQKPRVVVNRLGPPAAIARLDRKTEHRYLKGTGMGFVMNTGRLGHGPVGRVRAGRVAQNGIQRVAISVLHDVIDAGPIPGKGASTGGGYRR